MHLRGTRSARLVTTQLVQRGAGLRKDSVRINTCRPMGARTRVPAAALPPDPGPSLIITTAQHLSLPCRAEGCWTLSSRAKITLQFKHLSECTAALKMKYTKSDMNHRFIKRLNELICSKTQNTKLFTKLQYAEMIQKVKISKVNTNKRPEDYQRLRRFDVVTEGDVDKLIAARKEGSSRKYYVHIDEIFEVLHETHLAIGHGGRNKMEKALGSKYKNITREMIGVYLHLCKTCEKKHNSSKKGAAENSILTTEMNSRGQIDLINMQGQRDGEYKFIMVYRDHVTKFVQLRPLTSDATREITLVLLDLFTTFGAPNILQSERGRQFVSEIINEMSGLWPELKMVHGHPRNTQSQGERENREIENMLRSWLTENNTDKWTEGIRFIQLMMNGTHNPSINCSPYEAMFGTTIKLGLPTDLSEELPCPLVTEEELRAFLNN